MHKNPSSETRRNLLFCFVILGLAAAMIAVPYHFRSTAVSPSKAEITATAKTSSHEKDLENYDIRTDKKAFEKLAGFRRTANKSAATVADARDAFVAGEAELKRKVPTLKVEYNAELKTPEVIAPDVAKGKAVLSEALAGSRADTLRSFVRGNEKLLGVSSTSIETLKTTADYTNPDGNLSFAELEQNINGIPVFRGEVKAGFNKKGEIIRVINNLAPGLESADVSTDFRNPANAVSSAAKYVNFELKTDLTRAESIGDETKVKFGTDDWAPTAEKVYFPTEPGVAVPAWKVLIWKPVNAYYVIVDAENGTMLWRKNITEDQTQAATYNVYANPNAMINSADNPAPLTPGPVSPSGGIQGALIARTNVTRVGNEAPYTFNNNGWISDGNNVTDGNNVQAGIDRVEPDGIDAPVTGDNRVFTSTWNPPPGNPAPGDSPLTPQAQNGAVIQMFYMMNLYHDELYRLGFTEQARNFQSSNFGRGGLGNDRISAEAQDYSGSNNAGFATPSDGGRGKMQMYLWTRPVPNYDGTTDMDIVIHEVTHGTSNRLHGNANGLVSNMSRGMGEGWGDFYAHALLSEPSDPLNGIYTIGGYALYSPSSLGNYYYGIRRFPKAIMAATGGPNNRPHNPLTFADIDATQINLNDGAFARGPNGAATADQVHNMGEVWSSALWEVRAKFIARLGWQVGNRRVLQYVTDGMKLAPLAPTFLQERDAIIAAAQASLPTPQANADTKDVWEGFRIRGMGFSAKIINPGTGSSDTRVVEAFDTPNLSSTLTFSDASGNNNGNFDPGETITVTVPLVNNTGENASDISVEIVGGSSASYGSIVNTSSASRQIAYTIPSGAVCGSAISLTFKVNSSLGAMTFTRSIILGTPIPSVTENFDGVTAPNLPANWTVESISGGVNFVTAANGANSAPNAAFAIDPLTVGGGTNLTSPSVAITAQAGIVTFQHKYLTENLWDGGVLEISLNDGNFEDILSAGGSFIENGYNSFLGDGTNNPLANRAAWTGNSGGYISTKVQLPAAAAGKNVRLRWRFGADDNTAPSGGGWSIDDIQIIGNFSCDPVSNTLKSRADFDGDGKSDVSVFRPADGNWYVNRSTAGFISANWGAPTDIITPGDFDGDKKTDTAVFRPSNGTWYIIGSANGFSSVQFGQNGDQPVSGDYDGDGKDDIAVYRPSNGTWYRLNSSNNGFVSVQWGQTGDKPIVADFDGDKKADIAVFRTGTGYWYIIGSTNGFSFAQFGESTDKLVPGDYDGDNKDDIAVFRPSNGTWYRLNSSNNQFVSVQFGESTDIPVPGDYDGDNKDDIAVYRSGRWYLNNSRTGFSFTDFGATTDKAIPTGYIPN